MYEQYLREPSSVGEEWRKLFDNGRLAELPVIPTDRAEVLREEGRGTGDGPIAAPATRPPSPVSSPQALTLITGPAARLAQNMADSLPRSEERRVGKEMRSR